MWGDYFKKLHRIVNIAMVWRDNYSLSPEQTIVNICHALCMDFIIQ